MCVFFLWVQFGIGARIQGIGLRIRPAVRVSVGLAVRVRGKA